MKIFLFLSFFLSLSALGAGQTLYGDLQVNGKIRAVSTTKASHPCPSMSDDEMLAISSPQDGDCVNNSTLNTWLVYDGVEGLWEEVGSGGGLSPWESGEDYDIDAIVVESNKIYKALTAHTSGTFATDLAANRWIRLNDEFNVHSANGVNLPIKKLRVPNKQLTQTATSEARAETGNKNILENPSFEHQSASTGWQSTLNTIVLQTSGSIEGTNHIEVSASGQSLDFYQDSTINALAFADGIQGLASIWVKTSLSNIFACARIAGQREAINKCVSVTSNNKWGLYKVPFIMGATSNGIGVYSLDAAGNAVAVTGLVKVDDAFVGAQDVRRDDLSVRVQTSSLGLAQTVGANATVTGTATIDGSGIYTYNSATGIYTVTKDAYFDITASFQVGATQAQASIEVNGVSTSLDFENVASGWSSASWSGKILAGQTFRAWNSAGAGSSNLQRVFVKAFDVVNSGVYSASNSNYNRTQYTPSLTGITASSTECFHSRDGQYLDIDCKVVVSGASATEMRVSLPVVNGAQLTTPGGVTGTRLASSATKANAATPTFYALWEASQPYLTFGISDASNGGLLKVTGSGFTAAGQTIAFNARLPINGWDNPNQIIGTFREVGITPGVNTVHNFSVSYGNAVGSVCTVSPCAYLDQIGTVVTSITRTATGAYLLNTSRTYSKLKCSVTATGSTVISIDASPHCSNCSSLPFATKGSTNGAQVDTIGTLICQGLP